MKKIVLIILLTVCAFSVFAQPRKLLGFTGSAGGTIYYDTLRSLNFTAPLFPLNDSTAAITQATTSTNGYLSSTDWNTFNSKGSVSSVATGFGITGGTITTTGTLKADSSVLLTKLGAAAIYATPYSGTGYSKFAGTTASFLTPTQVTADLNVFTTLLQGVVPAGVSSAKILHGDGTWKDTTAAGAATTIQQAITNGNTLTKKDTVISSASQGIWFKGSVLRGDTLSIGDAAPASLVSVLGGANGNIVLSVKNSTTGTAAISQIQSINDLGGIMSFQAISSGYTTSGTAIAGSGRLITTTGLTGGMVLVTGGTNPMIFGTNLLENMRLNGANGHLLIGTTTDISPLTVTGDINASASITTPIHYGGTTTTSTLTLRSSSSGSATTGSDIDFLNGGTQNAVLLFNGNFGIGTNAPAHHLHVVESSNASNYAAMQNLTAGTASQAGYLAQSDGGYTYLGALSSAFTTSGLAIASTGRVYTSVGMTGGLVIATGAAAPIMFFPNSTQSAEFLSNGHLLLNTLIDSSQLTVNGSLTLLTAGSKIKIIEGTNGSVGQTTLVAGTKAITISGVTTSTRAFCQLVSQGGTVTTTVNYEAVCTANTLTINAVTNAGNTLNTLDTSILNYHIIN